MPVFNGRHFIDEAVQSIINQSYKNFELLIIDDGSSDSSWEIIQKLKSKHPKFIKVFKLNRNGGAFRATNYALKHAKGEFIALMDCDDVSHPQRFAKQIEYFEKHTDISILGTQARVINQNGEEIGRKKVPLKHQDIYQEFGILHPMIHPSCMVKRMLSSGKDFKYLIKYGVNDDYYTFFKLLNSEKFANLDEQLLDYRIHMNNSSLKDIKKKFFYSLRIRLEAQNNLKYRFNSRSIMLILMQIAVMTVVPEKMTFYIYLVYKKIIPLRHVFKLVSSFRMNLKIPKFFTTPVNSEI